MLLYIIMCLWKLSSKQLFRRQLQLKRKALGCAPEVYLSHFRFEQDVKVLITSRTYIAFFKLVRSMPQLAIQRPEIKTVN